MSVTYKNFSINDSVSGTSNAATDTLYTCSSGRGLINQATIKNADASNSVTVHFYILISGGDPTTVSPIWSQEVAAGESAIVDGLLGHVVPSGGTIRAYASTADDAKVTISGTEIV